jgi:hypothetical protein
VNVIAAIIVGSIIPVFFYRGFYSGSCLEENASGKTREIDRKI